ncbi:MAG: GPR endopeptidase [Longicatena sp.]
MMNKYQIRSDFADEFITQDVRSQTFEHIEKQNDFVKSNYIKVLQEENELHKSKGDYVSIECKNLNDHSARLHMIEAIDESLHELVDHMNINLQKILIVGLGNRFITSDALGPGVANEILVTAHLYENEDHETLKGTRNVAVLQPGVMGQTGLESSRIIESVAAQFQPDLIIAVDALATRNIGRINRVVQINNTGIQPGSGVGNHRRSLDEKTLHVPVIAIGVATVTSVGAIIKEALQESDIQEEGVLDLLYDAKHLDLVVTPKTMDDELKHLIYIVSESLNYFLHPDYENL